MLRTLNLLYWLVLNVIHLPVIISFNFWWYQRFCGFFFGLQGICLKRFSILIISFHSSFTVLVNFAVRCIESLEILMLKDSNARLFFGELFESLREHSLLLYRI